MGIPDFAEIVMEEAFLPAVSGVVANLESPPGRRPADDLASASRWYLSLGPDERAHVAWVAAAGAHGALFCLLSVIDGASQSVCDSFELVGIVGDNRHDLIPPNEGLHEAFQALVMTGEGKLRF
jgi:hypothetical protein